MMGTTSFGWIAPFAGIEECVGRLTVGIGGWHRERRGQRLGRLLGQLAASHSQCPGQLGIYLTCWSLSAIQYDSVNLYP